MSKRINKTIALIAALTSVCGVGLATDCNLFKEANAISYVVDKGELTSLSVKSMEGEKMELLNSFDEEDEAEFDGNDKEYKVILPKGSEGLKISAQVKSGSNKDDDDDDDDDDKEKKYVLRIFTSNSDDAKAYKSGDEININDDFTTIYIRTYKSEDKFKDLYFDGEVTTCAETYKIIVKKEEASSEDYSGTVTTAENIVLPKINITETAEVVQYKNQWVQKGNYWLYYNENGDALRDAWYQNKNTGKYYYMQTNGYMTTGWRFIDGDWYYFDQSGEMKTGWVQSTDGAWYYLMDSGKMARSTSVGGYRLNAKGKLIN